METPPAHFLCKLGGLRFELKNFEDSLVDPWIKSELKRVLAQLDAISLTLGNIQSRLSGEASVSHSNHSYLHQSIDFYQSILCSELPYLAPDWVVWRRDSNSIGLIQLISENDVSLTGSKGIEVVVAEKANLGDRVTIHFQPETSETQVLFALTSDSGIDGIRYEFRPEHFLESFVELLRSSFELKFAASGIKVENREVEEVAERSKVNIKTRRKKRGVGNKAAKERSKKQNTTHDDNPVKREVIDKSSGQTCSVVDARLQNHNEDEVEYEENVETSDAPFDNGVNGANSPDFDISHRPNGENSPLDELNEEHFFVGDLSRGLATPESECPDLSDTVLPDPFHETTDDSFLNGDSSSAHSEAIDPDPWLVKNPSRRAYSKRKDSSKCLKRGPPTKAVREARLNKLREVQAKAEDEKGGENGAEEHICRLCGAPVSRYAASKHMATVHGSLVHECCFCPKSYQDVKDLKKHISYTHWRKMGRNLLPCKECNLPLCENECVDHNRIEHGKPLECPYCDYGSVSKDPADINVNLLTQQSLVTLSPEKNLKRHIYNDHFSKAFKKHRCTLCHTPYHLREVLEQHMNPNLDPAERKVTLCPKLRSGAEEKDPKAICAHCGQSFNESYLKTHIQRIHDPDNFFFKYECQFCGKRYEHPKRLRAHLLQSHFPEKRDMACHLCPKKFASHRMLKRHLLTHSSPSIKCPRCEKVFRTKNNMQQHLMSHFPPQYECLGCNRKFVYRCGLKTHLLQVHKFVDWENYVRKEPKERLPVSNNDSAPAILDLPFQPTV